MFDKIGDLPLHPLVIHAVVVGIPLAALLAVLFAIPRTREWARWPLAIVVVGATAVTFIARQSGQFDLAALAVSQSALLHHDRFCCYRPAQRVRRAKDSRRQCRRRQAACHHPHCAAGPAGGGGGGGVDLDRACWRSRGPCGVESDRSAALQLPLRFRRLRTIESLV
jgi:hypothetical protein